MKIERQTPREKRHRRIRQKVKGSSERPRLVVRRSLNNLFAQLLDDTANKTIFSCSTCDKEMKAKLGNAGNVKASTIFAEYFVQKAKAKGVRGVVFDRAGYLYHGRVKAFADGLRKGGLEF